jgi:hypothetical protein
MSIGGVFPTLSAGSDEFDDIVGALGMNNLVSTLGHSEFLPTPAWCDRAANHFGLNAIAASINRNVATNVSRIFILPEES